MTATGEQLVVAGKIAGLYGVRGWVRVMSYTQPRENLLRYKGWHLRRGNDWRPIEVVDGQAHGKGLVVNLRGCDDREQARALIGTDIAVPRSELPPPAEGEYYWADLVGLRVETVDGVPLGRVDYLFETGANDVLVARDEHRERLIPFVMEQVIKQVDIPGGVIRVDWDPAF